jgi:protein TonB
VNDVMQRMLPATVLTLALHGALLSWQMHLPETVPPKPPARKKISVSLERLPPPPPPLKQLVQEAPALPQLTAIEQQPLRPLLPRPKPEPLQKIVQKVPTVPTITKIQHKPLRPLVPKPPQKTAVAPRPLPKLASVDLQPMKPMVPRPVIKPQPSQQVRPVSPPQPVSRQQPVVRPTPTYQQTPVVRRAPVTRQVVSSTPRTSTRQRTVQRTSQQPLRRAAAPTSRTVVREAAPLYKTNPPPQYPRLAQRRGLEGLVTLEAQIDSTGRVTDLRIFTSSGHKILDKAALKSVRNWRFSPGTVGGRVQSMWVKVPVRFKLS